MDGRRKSRLSLYPRYGPRESIFGAGSETLRESNTVSSQFLKDCVSALEHCCDEVSKSSESSIFLPDLEFQAQEAQEILRQGTYDLPRMSRVLESERVRLLSDFVA